MNLIKKIPLTAFVLGLGLMAITITMSSFKGEKRNVSWYYIGSEFDDITDASLYTQSSTAPELATCGQPDPTLPCQISVPDSVITVGDLEDYFLEPAHDTPTKVYNQSITKRP